MKFQEKAEGASWCSFGRRIVIFQWTHFHQTILMQLSTKGKMRSGDPPVFMANQIPESSCVLGNPSKAKVQALSALDLHRIF